LSLALWFFRKLAQQDSQLVRARLTFDQALLELQKILVKVTNKAFKRIFEVI